MTNTFNFNTNYGNKGTSENNTLTAEEWNGVMTNLDSFVNSVPTTDGGSDSGVVSTEVDPLDADKTIVKVNDVTVGELTVKGTKGVNVSVSGNNNVNIEPRPAAGTGEGKNTPGLANRKGGNISLKPGDDIELCSHKRGTGKNTEVAVKVIDGSENPVKLQVFAGDITLSTKGKGSTKTKDANGADTQNLLYDDPNVMNVNVTTGNGKGYLKVRAQAIDLRCEDHGGIALQPKGADNTGTTLNTIAAGIYTSNEAAVGYYFDLTHGIDFNSAGLYQIIDPNNRIPSGGTAKLAFMDSSFHTTDIAEKDITLPYTLTSEELITLNLGGYKLFVYIIEGKTEVILNVSDNLYIVKVTRKENKIKFEHGGGDGLEFGTFNSQKTSIFTDEYRFNQNGTILLSSRIKEQSDKADPDDDTTTYKYQKQADDFYDIIGGRRDVTWRDVVTIIGELKDMKANNQGPWANA